MSENGKVPNVELQVGPANGRGLRLVVALRHGEEMLRDEFSTNKLGNRVHFIDRLAEEAEVDREQLEHLVSRIAQLADQADAEKESAANRKPESPDPLASTPRHVLADAQRFLANPRMIDELEEDLCALGVVGEDELKILLYVIGTSRLLDHPLSAIIKAPSATGKSYVLDKVVSLIPPEVVLRATDLTPNALYYLPYDALRHILIYAGERKHATDDDPASMNSTRALREMVSGGRLDKLVPMRSANGGMVTTHIVREGPIAYVETTTQEEIFEEDATRLLNLVTDESEEQTARVIRFQAEQAAGTAASPDLQRSIRAKHHAAQRLLRRAPVRIPFAALITVPTERVAARRVFPQLLSCIQAVALLRQGQKPMCDGVLIADLRDYEIAYGLIRPALVRAYAPVSKRALDLLAVLKHRIGSGRFTTQFTRADCCQWTGLGLTEVRTRLTTLVVSSLIRIVEGGHGREYRYTVAPTSEPNVPTLHGLLTPDDLRAKMAAVANE